MAFAEDFYEILNRIHCLEVKGVTENQEFRLALDVLFKEVSLCPRTD